LSKNLAPNTIFLVFKILKLLLVKVDDNVLVNDIYDVLIANLGMFRIRVGIRTETLNI
jgi:hypothetical protein